MLRRIVLLALAAAEPTIPPLKWAQTEDAIYISVHATLDFESVVVESPSLERVTFSATGATRDARAYAFDLLLREDVSPSATRWRRECAGGCHVLITLEKAHGGHFFDRLLAVPVEARPE